MNKWISVEDELPKYSDLYIVYCNIGSIMGGFKEVRAYDYSIVNGKTRTEKWCIPDNTYEVVSVTHWMELPEPPEESE